MMSFDDYYGARWDREKMERRDAEEQREARRATTTIAGHTRDDKLIASLHEAGHTVVGAILGLPIYACLVERNESGHWIGGTLHKAPRVDDPGGEKAAKRALTGCPKTPLARKVFLPHLVC